MAGHWGSGVLRECSGGASGSVEGLQQHEAEDGRGEDAAHRRPEAPHEERRPLPAGHRAEEAHQGDGLLVAGGGPRPGHQRGDWRRTPPSLPARSCPPPRSDTEMGREAKTTPIICPGRISGSGLAFGSAGSIIRPICGFCRAGALRGAGMPRCSPAGASRRGTRGPPRRRPPPPPPPRSAAAPAPPWPRPPPPPPPRPRGTAPPPESSRPTGRVGQGQGRGQVVLGCRHLLAPLCWSRGPQREGDQPAPPPG